MGVRYEDDEEARKTSGFANSTYKTIFDRLEQEGSDVWPTLCPFIPAIPSSLHENYLVTSHSYVLILLTGQASLY